MKDELVSTRFGENKRPSCGRWINHRMGMVWAHADWPFRKAIRETAEVDASGVVTMPSTFRRMLWAETTDEQPIHFLDPATFRATWGAANSESATQPTSYTVVNGVAYVRPKGSSSIYIAYERKMCHLHLGATVTVGEMVDDTDEPVWDDEFHYLLVLGAMATGLKTENDPTWESLETEFAIALGAMREEYLPPDGVVNRQFGRIED